MSPILLNTPFLDGESSPYFFVSRTQEQGAVIDEGRMIEWTNVQDTARVFVWTCEGFVNCCNIVVMNAS